MSTLARDTLDPALYLAVREAEGRIYPDAVVATLPAVAPGVAHRDEWRVRDASARRLEEYLRSRSRPLRILDLGCGNGWLAARLAGLPECRVWGFDTNRLELAQGGRVFRQQRLGFLAGDIEQPPFGAGAFDVVCVASSIQYFADLAALVRNSFRLLGPAGEVHILDSPLYEDSEVAAAEERSREYYERLGFPEMAVHYHHHALSSLAEFDIELLYNPKALSSRLRRSIGGARSPFPWLRLRAKS